MKENSGKLVFVGGVHGVGKSTICKLICDNLGIGYLSASDLIKWSELNTDPRNKLVLDIAHTQDRLVTALNASIQIGKKYLLDGHFCLFNSQSEVIKISLCTFQSISPSMICVITGKPQEIEQSQRQRGGQVYSQKRIEEMQNLEVAHARQISLDLKVLFIQASRSSVSDMSLQIKNIFEP
jgi:adenylate kinase